MKEKISVAMPTEKKELSVREMRPDISMEKITNRDQIEEAKKIIKAVNTENNVIGAGSRADILNNIVEYDDGGNPRYFCVKKNVRTPIHSEQQHSLDEEAYYQAVAHGLLHQAKDKEKLDLVEVPSVVSYIEDDKDGKYLVMNQINGTNIWRKIVDIYLAERENVRQQVLDFCEKKYQRISLAETVDVEIENALIEIINGGSVEGLADKIIKSATTKPFLTETQRDQIINSINYLNDHGFYHRDLHSKNIMIDNNGKVYFIDYATAIYDDPAHGKGVNIHEDDKTDHLVLGTTIMKFTHKSSAQQQIEAERVFDQDVERGKSMIKRIINTSEITDETLVKILQARSGKVRSYLFNWRR